MIFVKNKKQYQHQKGSITVFLTLILLLILSLIMSVIEGARIAAAKTFAERAFITAMDSVLAEYYAPLMEEYHILGLESGYGGTTPCEDLMADKMEDYMSYTFTPNKELSNLFIPKSSELYGISVENVSITDQTRLTDYQGEIFINEATAYMKYAASADLLSLLLNKVSLLEAPNKVSYLYEEKQKVEEELVEIDEGILNLMKLLDGVKTSKKGIDTKKDGSLKTVDYFVKKIIHGGLSKDKVEINNESIFAPLKGLYHDTNVNFDTIERCLTRIEEIVQILKDLQIQYDSLTASINSKYESAASLNSDSEQSEETTAQLEAIYSEISALQEEQSELSNQMQDYEDEKEQCISDVKDNKATLSKLVIEIKPKIEEAIKEIDHIIEKMGTAEGLIQGYEGHLYEKKDEVGEEVFQGLEEDLGELKRYTGDGIEQTYDFPGMKQILMNNLNVLNMVETELDQGGTEFDNNQFGSAGISFGDARSNLNGYQITGLRIDYSTLVLNKKEDNDPLSMIKSLIGDGIMGLVVEPDSISKAELTGDQLPSSIASLSGDSGGFSIDLTSIFDAFKIGDKNPDISSMFGSFGGDSDGLSAITEGLNEAAEHLLFEEYILKHFYQYPVEKEPKDSRKPSVLTYEQEYILIGDSKDSDNIKSVISRIVFIRTILNFVTILSDKTRCSEAELCAAALVGFTGLPILVSITKTLILIVWAFAEGLVDTCALLANKSVPIIKQKGDLLISFTDLFLLNRTFIEKKASGMKDGGILSLNYKDYMRIFLLLKKKEISAYRSMDLIQENLQIRYEDTFLMQNCLYGFGANAKFNIAPKFISSSLFKKYTGSSISGYQYEFSSSYSY